MRKLIAALFLSISISGISQIVDDSTELVYGPKTTRFIYERQVLNNEINYTYLDTSSYLFERHSLVDKNERKYQNLGSFGTALFPVFYNPQQVIGRTSGYNAYQPYFRNSNNIRFFDTKSPVIDLLAYLGGANQNKVDVDFSRNVREDWNVGFDLHTITTDKQLANNGEADRQVVATAFDIYSFYKNNKVPYQALFYYSNMSHNAFELGGVRYTPDSLQEDLFEVDNALLRLVNAQAQIRQKNWHLYQEYQLADQFQVYHMLDYNDEQHTYEDFNDGIIINDYNTYLNAYDQFLIDSDSTHERANFTALVNEAGIKGDLSSIFYRAYLKLRRVDFSYFLLDPVEPLTETYLGGYARFNWKEKFKVVGEAELLQGGEYKFTGSLKSDLVNVTYQSLKYNVPFIYGRYFSNHYEWNNNFSPVFVNRVEGNIKVVYKFFDLTPKVSFMTYNDYVYFNESRTPSQTRGGIVVSTVGGDADIRFMSKKGEGFFIENEFLATNVSGGSADVIRIPELFYNGRYYWRGLLFDDKVPVEIGLDTHARSAYFGNAYDPITQQFYLQNELELPGYFKADFFLNMRLDKFYLSFKWQHIDQPTDRGYFASPYFPGQPRVIDFIVRWRFFD